VQPLLQFLSNCDSNQLVQATELTSNDKQYPIESSHFTSTAQKGATG